MKPAVLIVDGYNIIGAWEELKELKARDMGSARDQLISVLAAFCPWSWERIIIVFDGRDFAWDYVDGVEVVYTGRKETADTMIERLSAGLSNCCHVEVSTSDSAEYRAASAYGAVVMSARVLKEELGRRRAAYNGRLAAGRPEKGIPLNHLLESSVAASLEKLRRS